MKVREKKKSGGEGGAKWLTTFNDLMTNLMVFFLLLFSMGHISTAKNKDFTRALQSGLGVLLEGEQVEVIVADEGGYGGGTEAGGDLQGGGELSSKTQIDSTLLFEGADSLASRLQGLEELKGISTKETSRGLLIRLENEIFFDSGKAEIREGALTALEKVGAIIKDIPNSVRVEGHTDNVPIKTDKFPSNWELSTHRALAVVQFFIDRAGVEPARLSAAGYGESRPVAPNDSIADRARNRRVEILLVK